MGREKEAMTPRYAERTHVAVGATRHKIERLLDNHGAKAFVSGWDRDQRLSSVMFDLADRRIRFTLHCQIRMIAGSPEHPPAAEPRPLPPPSTTKRSDNGGGRCSW
jgi:hypothetical protein